MGNLLVQVIDLTVTGLIAICHPKPDQRYSLGVACAIATTWFGKDKGAQGDEQPVIFALLFEQSELPDLAVGADLEHVAGERTIAQVLDAGNRGSCLEHGLAQCILSGLFPGKLGITIDNRRTTTSLDPASLRR